MPARQQGANLVEQAARELLVDAADDAFGYPCRRKPYADRQKIDVRQQRSGVAEMIGYRAAGQQVHLQRTHHPFGVTRLNAHRRCRIDPLQQTMQRGDATPRRQRLEPRSQRLGHGRARETVLASGARK